MSFERSFAKACRRSSIRSARAWQPERRITDGMTLAEGLGANGRNATAPTQRAEGPKANYCIECSARVDASDRYCMQCGTCTLNHPAPGL